MAVVRFQDYYSALGVWQDSPGSEITAAYNRLALKYKPYVESSIEAREKYSRLTEAYEVLKDPKKRKRYNTLGEDWKHGEAFTPPGWDCLRAGVKERSKFDVERGFSDFYSLLFGETSPFERVGGMTFVATGDPKKIKAGQSFEVDLKVFLEDVYLQKTKTVTVLSMREGFKNYQVKIPPGVTDGSIIRLAGRGAQGEQGSHSGDLLVKLHFEPHEIFKIEGFNLISSLLVSPWEAVLGEKVKVKTMDGEVSLTLPPNSQNGKRLRLKGKGLGKKGGRGDLLVEVKIVIPEQINDRERGLYTQLREASSFNPRKEQKS